MSISPQIQRRLSKDEGNSEGEKHSHLVPLNTDHMQGVFYILSVSYICAILIVLVELIGILIKRGSA